MSEHKYIVWKSLTESQIMHKLLVLTQYSKKAKDTINTVYYNIGRAILQIKSKPQKNLLIQKMFGNIIDICQAKYRVHLRN